MIKVAYMLPSLVTPVVISEINVTETDLANASNDRASDEIYSMLVTQACEKSRSTHQHHKAGTGYGWIIEMRFVVRVAFECSGSPSSRNS